MKMTFKGCQMSSLSFFQKLKGISIVISVILLGLSLPINSWAMEDDVTPNFLHKRRTLLLHEKQILVCSLPYSAGSWTTLNAGIKEIIKRKEKSSGYPKQFTCVDLSFLLYPLRERMTPSTESIRAVHRRLQHPIQPKQVNFHEGLLKKPVISSNAEVMAMNVREEDQPKALEEFQESYIIFLYTGLEEKLEEGLKERIKSYAEMREKGAHPFQTPHRAEYKKQKRHENQKSPYPPPRKARKGYKW